MKNVYLIAGGVVAIAVIVAGYFIANASYTTEDFAECLSDADIVMYGTDWCSACAEQKKMFEDAFEGSFSKVDFVNCDFNSEECDDAEIEGYPTWKIGGEFLGNPGGKTFLELATAGGCGLPSE